MQRYTIRYVYGSYAGEEIVHTDDEATDDDAVHIMWRRLKPHMTLGMAAKGARVVRRELIAPPTKQGGRVAMVTRYRYFIAFTQTTSGPRGETVVRNDVLFWPKAMETGEDLEALEQHLNERADVPADHIITNFILLGVDVDAADDDAADDDAER